MTSDPRERTAETDALVGPLRAALGEEAWEAAYAAGQALSLEEAVAEALDDERTQPSPNQLSTSDGT